MSDETTPLTANVGPAYVFPGGVPLRSRRQKLQRFQWCMGLSFLVIIITALLIAWALTDNYIDKQTPVLPVIPDNDTDSESDKVTTSPLDDEPATKWAFDKIKLNHTVGEDAVRAGVEALGDRELLEESIETTPVHSPAFRHYRSLSTNAEGRKLARRGYIENHATMRIAKILNYTKPTGRSNIGFGPSIPLPDPTLNLTCNFNARYRTPNGTCNSKVNPRFYGAAMIPYRRMVAPDYADGISQPRSAYPSARDVSLNIHRSTYETDSNFTVMLAVFGQFLDHDITATSLTTSQEGESINCCTVPLSEHPECYPVPILPDDPFYQQYNVTCMNFVRSAPAPTGHFGPRQQLNQATSFIDGSVVYGSTAERQQHLRTMINGTMRMYILKDGRELLPLSTNLDDGCNRAQMTREGKYCFESGDDRANENLLLTSMHLLWAREHNYLARGLQELNPLWDDETVYQEARKIVGAQMAHITYNEFLPILFGRERAGKKGLSPNKDNIYESDTYDRHVDPSIANCFASAAFRFAHTLLPGLFNISRNNSVPEAVELHKMLFNPFSLWQQNGIDSALMAAVNTPVQRVDRFFSLEITQKLFEGTKEDKLPVCGLDLVSLNIQRGRDHGLPTYPVFRRHCRLPPVDTWEQMSTVVDPAALTSIQKIYNTPQEVDVYTGALSEPPLKGAIFGPLLTCMVSDQFLRLKKGDSHWYERKFGPQRFTKDQLYEIYQTTLAHIICRNSDNIQQIRKYVMEHRKDEPNVYVNCEELKTFNFTAWRSDLQSPKLHRTRLHQFKSLVRSISSKTAFSSTTDQSIATKITTTDTKTTEKPSTVETETAKAITSASGVTVTVTH